MKHVREGVKLNFKTAGVKVLTTHLRGMILFSDVSNANFVVSALVIAQLTDETEGQEETLSLSIIYLQLFFSVYLTSSLDMNFTIDNCFR